MDDLESDIPGLEDLGLEIPGLQDLELNTDDCVGGICYCYLFSNIIAVGFTCLMLWLSFRRMRPRHPSCSIEYFYVPALNKSLDSHLNTTINFMVRLDNPNKDKGIYYDDVYLSLSSPYTATNSSALVANYTVPQFYQGFKKKAKKWGQTLPLNSHTLLQTVLPSGLAVFRVDLKTKVRFKIVFFKTKRFRVEVSADVEVNGDGVKANNVGVKMLNPDSSSPSLGSYFPFPFSSFFHYGF
ncbi:unnamed protein product [Arabis nemorensis]|uniref:Late embryogenesis abundant protein LEA-2 subgroup domain-containing protein n=1 Tax=Arabis nemorensis TaxID=586526 RepID=A0A565BBG6_9BRAS|nr:unnamed protein product [Arabis nemorensis]